MRIALLPILLVTALVCGCKPSTPAAPSATLATASSPPEANATPTTEPDLRADALAAPAARRHPSPAAGAPGKFDFYLFTLSWSPEFCLTHAQDAECRLHLGYTVHGLWPQNNNGTYPERCGNQPGPTNPASWSDIIPDPTLIAHEWATHGTCSGLAADAYFAQIRKAFHEVVIPPALNTPAPGTMLAPAVILADLAQANPSFPPRSFALTCGNNDLTAAQVCLSRTLQPIACPGVKTCGATIVKIAPRATH